MKGNGRRNFIHCVSVICIVAFLMMPIAHGEQAAWDCPDCGRLGNTGNYCGGCAHPAPWLESDTPEEYKPYVDVIDRIEAIAAEDPWSLEKIVDAFVKKYGSEKAVSNLKSYTFHRFDKENVTLSYYYGDWYYTYSVRYYDDKHKNLLCEHEYIRVVDQSYCDTNRPTYSNWFSAGVELVPLASSSGKKYHLYCGDSYNTHNSYVEEEYYDSVTVSQYIVWDGWELFIKKN